MSHRTIALLSLVTFCGACSSPDTDGTPPTPEYEVVTAVGPEFGIDFAADGRIVTTEVPGTEETEHVVLKVPAGEDRLAAIREHFEQNRPPPRPIPDDAFHIVAGKRAIRLPDRTYTPSEFHWRHNGVDLHTKADLQEAARRAIADGLDPHAVFVAPGEGVTYGEVADTVAILNDAGALRVATPMPELDFVFEPDDRSQGR